MPDSIEIKFVKPSKEAIEHAKKVLKDLTGSDHFPAKAWTNNNQLVCGVCERPLTIKDGVFFHKEPEDE